MEPVGAREIAERLGVEQRTVVTWHYRKLLPEPRWTVSGNPAWEWRDVERWAEKTGRLKR
jgi:DNA-binding transcriptional MerR regulator